MIMSPISDLSCPTKSFTNQTYLQLEVSYHVFEFLADQNPPQELIFN